MTRHDPAGVDAGERCRTLANETRKFVLVGLANHAGPDGTGAFLVQALPDPLVDHLAQPGPDLRRSP